MRNTHTAIERRHNFGFMPHEAAVSGQARERERCKCQVHQPFLDRGWQQLLTLGGISRLLSSPVVTVNSQERVSTDTCTTNKTQLSGALAGVQGTDWQLLKTVNTHIVQKCQGLDTECILLGHLSVCTRSWHLFFVLPSVLSFASVLFGGLCENSCLKLRINIISGALER